MASASALLALDLGTTTGWCFGTVTSHASGTWHLKPGRYDGGGMRFVKFRARLRELHEANPIGRVVYEEVRRHAGTDAAHVYGGLMGVLTEFCETEGIPYEAAPVGEIKKAWAGRGNASKEEMIAEAERQGYVVADDNEADAIALFHLKVGEM